MNHIASPSTPFTVEINQSYNPVNKQWHNDIFGKLYTAALDAGFLTALSDRDGKTLCVIARHMDSAGQCYPSRDHIGPALGVNPVPLRTAFNGSWRFGDKANRWCNSHSPGNVGRMAPWAGKSIPFCPLCPWVLTHKKPRWTRGTKIDRRISCPKTRSRMRKRREWAVTSRAIPGTRLFASRKRRNYDAVN